MNELDKAGLIDLYKALNEKMLSLAQTVRTADVSLSGEDKQFERYWKIATECGKTVEAIKTLRSIIFDNEAKEDDKDRGIGRNPMELLSGK